MNRISINLLCIIFITVLAASLLVPGLAFTTAFITGVNDGIGKAPNGDVIAPPTVPVEVIMDSGMKYAALQNDTITTDDGQELVMRVRRASLQIPEHKYSLASMLTVAISYLCVAGIFIFLIIQLIKFATKINRGIIFDRRNAAHLNKIGIALLLIAVLEIIPGICEDYVVSSLNATIQGMGLTSYWTIPWSEFLLGIMALMMGRIWIKGIRLKEDQELTI